MNILARIKGSGTYQMDPLILIFLTFSVLVNSYLAVKYAEKNIYASVANILFICLALTGLILHHVFCGGIKFDKHIAPSEGQHILTYSLAGFFLVLIAQTLVFQLQAHPEAIVLTTMLENKLFYMTAGVAEELFFRYYVQTKVEQSLPYAKFASVFFTSLLFTVYHFTVYGTNITLLYAVFVSSLILGIIYFLSKRLSIPTIIHCMVNFVAS